MVRLKQDSELINGLTTTRVSLCVQIWQQAQIYSSQGLSILTKTYGVRISRYMVADENLYVDSDLRNPEDLLLLK